MDKIFIIALIFGVTILFSYSSSHEDYYENYTQLLSSQALKDGKLPDIKTGAKEIHVHHRSGIMIEDPRVVVSYKYTGKGPESEILRNSCREKQNGQIQPPSEPPSFWNGKFDESYKFYHCITLDGAYAVSDKYKTAWFWRNKKD